MAVGMMVPDFLDSGGLDRDEGTEAYFIDLNLFLNLLLLSLRYEDGRES